MQTREESFEGPAFSIVPARAEDLLSICEIDRECFSSGYDTFSLRQLLDLCQGLAFVARSGEEAIGYAICAPEALRKERAWLLSLAVRRPWRRQGIGRELTLRRLRALKELGVKECRMTCPADNKISLVLHEQLGWRQESYQEDYYGSGESRIVLLRSV